jgi:IclR family pca regulon transcriptional regulator
LSDVARKSGLTRAAARRNLLTLTALGYAEFDGRYFRLTPRVIKLGNAYFSTAPIPKLAQPVLEEVGEKTGEVASLALLDGTDVVYVARSSPRRIVAVVGVGVRIPAVIAGTGRVLLASRAENVVGEMLKRLGRIKKRTPNTKTSHAEILAEIRLARSQGYSINDQEIELGLRSISVPVQNATGAVVAAMSVSTPPWRMTPRQMLTEILPDLRSAARKLGELT